MQHRVRAISLTVAIACSLLALTLSGCDSSSSSPTASDGGVCQTPTPAPTGPVEGVHGLVCATDADCEYGQCLASPAISGGSDLKFCTKSCTCGENSACGDDEPGLASDATCMRFGASSGETMLNFCAPVCANAGECDALGAGYNACGIILGAQKVCYFDPDA